MPKGTKEAGKKNTRSNEVRHPATRANGNTAEHGVLPAHDGPPKEPDPADISTEQSAQGADASKPAGRRRQLSDSDRITVLEHRLEALGRQLRQHGIHVNRDVAVALTEG